MIGGFGVGQLATSGCLPLIKIIIEEAYQQYAMKKGEDPTDR